MFTSLNIRIVDVSWQHNYPSPESFQDWAEPKASSYLLSLMYAFLNILKVNPVIDYTLVLPIARLRNFCHFPVKPVNWTPKKMIYVKKVATEQWKSEFTHMGDSWKL